MAAGVPFDLPAFIAGIHTAMTVGMPTRIQDQPVFVFTDHVLHAGSLDPDDVPYDWSVRPVVTPGTQLRVLCAVEYLDRAGQAVEFGILTPSQIRITLLDAEYQQIKGFSHVLIGQDRYNYRRTAPPQGMVTATIWTVYCQAEDET